MSADPASVAASVRQRLKNLSQRTGEDFQDVLFRYAAERFLYRLSASPHGDRFILKGATLFAFWSGGDLHRATYDLDLLGFGDSSTAEMERVFRDVAAVSSDDGIVYAQNSVKVIVSGDQRAYAGVRVQLIATLAQARITLRVDVGFGDAVHPPAAQSALPTILDLPAPILRLYPREAVVAEKFHAMVFVGPTTSRFKDFYDIWVLARDFAFDGQTLRDAIGFTFERRQTALPSEPPETLRSEFWSRPSSLNLWDGFLKKGEIAGGTPAFAEVAGCMAAFVLPPAMAAAAGEAFPMIWSPSGPWSQS
jgi:predicted nucleotidyltransferase component of viral defense system